MLVDGPQQEGGSTRPVGQRRAIELDPLAGVGLGLAIERQMIGVLGRECARRCDLVSTGRVIDVPDPGEFAVVALFGEVVPLKEKRAKSAGPA